MNTELTCSQVSALMSFYMENKLSSALNQHIQRHLDTCPSCAQKYENFQKIIDKYNNVIDDEYEVQFKQYDEFKLNLSAYVDNELESSENIKIKKVVISNQHARQDLEDLYTLRQHLHSAFEKTKSDVKIDLSRQILASRKTKSSFLTKILSLLRTDMRPWMVASSAE
jgi:anti-sigma factor RsiW